MNLLHNLSSVPTENFSGERERVSLVPDVGKTYRQVGLVTSQVHKFSFYKTFKSLTKSLTIMLLKELWS
jgi:hypothetical protein